MKIKKLDDIVYKEGSVKVIEFDATVLEVINEGDGDKRPFKVLLKLEDSGETLTCASWKFINLPTIKNLVKTDDIYTFEGAASIYGNYGNQIRLGEIRATGNKSLKKILHDIDEKSIKSEINTIISKYIRDDTLKLLLDQLILKNDKFFTWQAASKIHHAFKGGLALHSLNVCKNAISLWENYKGENINLEVLVTGALLHDIGKLQEYNEDGSRTIYGNLISHLVSGSETISKICIANGIDPDKNMNVLMLKHIILSHHEKLEFGAAVVPNTIEAWIVANADNMDAKMECSISSLRNTELYQETPRMISLDNGKCLKWKN